jgi:prophage regulatory protein
MQEQTISTTSKIIRLSELVNKIGLSRSTIYDKQNPKSPRFDPLFPKRIKIGSRAVGWLQSDLDAWLDSMIQLSSAGGEEGL